MSTRSLIAEPAENGWRGRYCHSDGYPNHNGLTLWELAHETTPPDPQALRQHLLHDHVEWSVLNERCYCHDGPPGRPPDARDFWVAATDQDDAGTEWAYLLGDDALTVFVRARPPGWTRRAWVTVATVPWDATVPEDAWGHLDHLGYRKSRSGPNISPAVRFTRDGKMIEEDETTPGRSPSSVARRPPAGQARPGREPGSHSR